MNPKLQKWLLRGAVTALVFCGFLFLTRDFWARHLRIYFRGQFEIRAEEFGELLPPVDEVEALALGGLNRAAGAGESDSGRVASYIITARRVLRGQDASDAAELWRELKRGATAMCHEPGYALRFFDKGKLLFETTVCWKCHNYSVEIGLPGYSGHSFQGFVDDKSSRALLTLLQANLPLTEIPPPSAESPR